MSRTDIRRRGDEENDNPLGMPDEIWIDLVEYHEQKSRRGGVDYKGMVDYLLDSPFGRDWFDNEYTGGNEFNLRQDLEEAFSEKEEEMGAEAKTRKAVEMIHEIEPADEKMLGGLFEKALREDPIRSKIMEMAWEAAEHIAQEGPHMERLARIVMDEGFADNESDAIDIVIELAEWWMPEISAMIRKGIDQ